MLLAEKYNKEAEHVVDLARAFDEANYFKVVVLAPQLYEKILSENDQRYNEWLEGKVGAPGVEELNIHQLYQRLLVKESIKARLAEYLLHFYEAGYWENTDPSRQFKKYFTKMESIFALRNTLAHEYFSETISSSRLEARAQECFEIVDLLLEHHLIY